MDAKVSTKTKTKTFQNLSKNCPLDAEYLVLSPLIPLKRERNIQTFFELKKWYDGLAQMKYKKPFVKPFEFNYKMEESIYLHFKYLQALKIATIPLHCSTSAC